MLKEAKCITTDPKRLAIAIILCNFVIVAVWWEYMQQYQQYMAAKLLCSEWSFEKVVERGARPGA